MRRTLALFVSILTSMMPLFGVHAVHALGANLIANPSVETQSTTDASLPQDWSLDSWGTNTKTSLYNTSAANSQDGTKSLYVQLTARTSGDAKWSHKEVAVTPNTSYTFSNYYKSNIASEIVVQTLTTTGTYSYQSLKAPKIATTWTNNTIAFTTVANAKAVTVFHLIKKVGWIYTDNYYLGLTVNTPTPTAPSVSITSPSTNATVSGAAVSITASASDSNGIAGVQFRADGTNVGAEDTTAPYGTTWNTTLLANGPHAISAVARNTAGISTTSTVINVTVSNNVTPTVTLLTPTEASTIVASTTLSADATGAAGVQFQVDGVSFGAEDTTSPYSIVWDSTKVSNGQHTVGAVARSTTGQIVSAQIVHITVTNSVTPPPTTTSLVVNPSVEEVDTVNTAKPKSWSNGKWGTNAVQFSYVTTGHTGARSVKTQITSYSSGDAKWFFDPVAITAGSSYAYSHYYKSTVTTDIVARYIDVNGVDSYAWLATVPATTTWQQFSATVTPPAGAKQMTVYHIIYSVGELQIDDAELTINTPPPTDTSVVKNGSFETANNAMPANWSTGSWGTNTPLFEYLSGGAFSGNRSVMLTMSNYTSGDAKWFFNPITTLQSGKMYRFSTRYKTNTIPKAVAQFDRTDGTTVYFGLPNPQPNGSGEWQYYSDTFTVPENTKDMTVFLMLDTNGWLQLDDQTISDYQPTGFNRALLTLTFDDGFEDNNTTVLPMTAAYGIKTTQCYATQFVAETPGNAQLVLDFKNAGHEICSHTVTHPFLTSLTSAQKDTELATSQTYLQNIIGTPVVNFASPYGDYDASTITEIKKFYRSHRTVDEGFNSKDNFDIYRIRVQNMLSTTTASQVQSWIQQAQATNTWLVLVYHKVSSSGVGEFDTYTADFANQLQVMANSGITIKTYNAALDELVSQL